MKKNIYFETFNYLNTTKTSFLKSFVESYWLLISTFYKFKQFYKILNQ